MSKKLFHNNLLLGRRAVLKVRKTSVLRASPSLREGRRRGTSLRGGAARQTKRATSVSPPRVSSLRLASRPSRRKSDVNFGTVAALSSRLSACCFAFCFGAYGCLQAADRPPNIVVILTDDQGYGDLGCFGSPNIDTPHLDRLAGDGMRFTSFYAAPICGPARAALMTGCYAPRISLGFNHKPTDTTGIHPDELTVAEMLRSEGYKTCLVGKWHLGDADPFLPTRHGFDQYFGLPYSNDMLPWHEMLPVRDNEPPEQQAIRRRAEYTGSHWKPGQAKTPHPFETPLPLIEGEQVIETMPDQTQLTTRYTNKAIDFIEQNQGGPFFLMLAHTFPHVYLHVSDKFRGKSRRGLYGDVIMEIDWSVGQIRQTLKRLDIDRDTLIVFTSDNGPWLSYGIDGGSAGPLRGGKLSVHEGGIRVPAIFSWPGKIPSGSRNNEIAAIIDLLPTFAEIVGHERAQDRVIDGKSLWPMLSGQTTESPHDSFYYFRHCYPGETKLGAVRDQRWKLMLKQTQSGDLAGGELFDLGADVGEKFDRRPHHPEKAARLLEQARSFASELAANVRPVGRLDTKRD